MQAVACPRTASAVRSAACGGGASAARAASPLSPPPAAHALHAQRRGACSHPRARTRSSRASMSASAQAAAGRDASPEVLDLWRRAQVVCFDVDSTVCTDEGIDELAAFLKVGDAVAALTASAMGGSVPFEQALTQRLAIMKPSRSAVSAFLEAHPPRLSPGIKELVQCLVKRGVAVYLVSGGFTQMIHPVADLLQLPRSHVFANTLLFDSNSGMYDGFDTTAYTSRSGGKARAITHIRSLLQRSPVVMIGDGATDAEARCEGGADAFIGYGGVVRREKVVAAADWFVDDLSLLTQALEA